MPEILQSLRRLQPDFDGALDFLPYRGDFPRGIYATAVIRDVALSQTEVDDLYSRFYAAAPFTFYTTSQLDMKQVVNTNKCIVHAEQIDNKLLVTSCIDNLLKGAAGQAVQNMNLMFGLDETTGLRLKSVAF